MCLNLLRAHEGLIVGDGLHSLLSQRVECRGILSQIELRSDQDNGDVRRMMVDLGVPLYFALSISARIMPCIHLSPKNRYVLTNLGLDVVERRRADDGEADEEDVGLRV